MKLVSAEICPDLQLSSLQTAWSLLHHKQLGLMSSDLTLMTDSASVPAGTCIGREDYEKSLQPLFATIKAAIFISCVKVFPQGCLGFSYGHLQKKLCPKKKMEKEGRRHGLRPLSVSFLSSQHLFLLSTLSLSFSLLPLEFCSFFPPNSLHGVP